MAKYLFIDTETTGLPIDWKAPVERVNNWPRLVQVAWIICNDDGQVNEEKEYIIYPENFVIPADATKVHKISNDMAILRGNPLNNVLLELNSHIDNSDFIIAHNMSFDEKIIGAEFYRKSVKTKLFSKQRICTMKSSTNYCAIPGNYEYKWPTLTELHQHLFKTRQEESHNALVDIRTTLKCFWKLNKLGVIKTKRISSSPPPIEKIVTATAKDEPKIEIEHPIEEANKVYLEFWNSLSDEWKNLILSFLPKVKNPNYSDFILSDNPYIPPFSVKKKLSNNDLAALKIGIENTRTITIENSKAVSDTKFDSIAPLKYFTNLQSLTIKEFLHLKDKKQISDLSPLSSLKQLRSLIIDCSPIRDLIPLSELKNIEVLEISHTKVSSLVPIKQFKNLRKLKLTCSPISTLEPLREIVTLTDLEFGCSTSTISDISPLKNHTNLRYLSMTHNPVYDISPVSNLTNLETLFLSWSPISNITALSNLTKLQVLWLHETKITSLAPLRNLKELVRLDFDKTQVTDIEPILNLPKLEMLSCVDSILTDEQIGRLKRQYPNASISSYKTKKKSGCLTLLFFFSAIIAIYVLI